MVSFGDVTFVSAGGFVVVSAGPGGDVVFDVSSVGPTTLVSALEELSVGAGVVFAPSTATCVVSVGMGLGPVALSAHAPSQRHMPIARARFTRFSA